MGIVAWIFCAVLTAGLEIGFVTAKKASTPVPVVLWHGMGDSCCSRGIGGIGKIIQKNISGIFVYSIEIGSNEEEDFSNSYFLSINKQIDVVCKNISQTPELQAGYNAIGFSQGGQFLRAVAQRCPNPPMLNLISIGGQHQGVFVLCNKGKKLETLIRINDLSSKSGPIRLVQAQYWHDSLNEKLYREKSLFLADVNNENVKNQEYKNNLQKLKNFVMVRFTKDTMVYPQESEWFGYYCAGSSTEICPLRNSTLYQEDWLGLQVMDQAGRLHFLEVEGEHLQFTEKWFLDIIVQPYLAPA